MGQIVTVHSYRGGTGKSNLTVNLAAALVARGRRVAILDTDLQSPGAHVLFGWTRETIGNTLVDFVYGKCELIDAAHDVSRHMGREDGGWAWLVPASPTLESISKIVSEGYDANRLSRDLAALMTRLAIDVLFIDTHPGLNRETLLALSITDILILVIRPDQQDYQGTAVLVEVAARLELPRVFLVANKVVTRFDSAATTAAIETQFGLPVIGLLPLSEDVASFGSRGIFVVRHPDHDITARISAIADRLNRDMP